MRELNGFELQAVAGGDRWCQEPQQIADTSGAFWGSEARVVDSGGGAESGGMPSAPSGLCYAGALGTLGAIGSAIRGPSADNLAKAGAAIGGFIGSGCGTAFLEFQGAVGLVNTAGGAYQP